MTDEDKGLRPIGQGVERMLRDLGMPDMLDPARLVDEWGDVAGEPFGSLSKPASFGGGVLTLEVSDGVAASLLKYRIGELLARFDDRFGTGVVTSVRIRVTGRKKGR